MGKKEIYIDKISKEELTKETCNYFHDVSYCNEIGYHRVDGPARIVHKRDNIEGYKAWWINDKLHSLDGPAVEFENGSKKWYINGKKYTEHEFNVYLRNEKLKNV